MNADRICSFAQPERLSRWYVSLATGYQGVATKQTGGFTLSESDWDADIRAIFPEWQSDAVAERWPTIKDSLSVGQTVTGKVISRAPFGVWLDISVGQPALLLVVNMEVENNRRIAFKDYPYKGASLTVRINALGDRGEIGLTQKNPDRMIEDYKANNQ